MGLSGCCCLVKYLLILINFAFWAAGIAAFGLFGFFLANSTSFLLPFDEAKNDYYIGLLVAVGVATLIIIIAFLGCCGSLKESQCMLVSFFCFLLIVLVAEIATGVYAYLNQDQLMQIIRNNVKHTIQHEYGSTELPTKVFDTFQTNLECCGIDGPLDWQTSKYNNNTKAINLDVSSPEAKFIIPESCCLRNATQIDCKRSTRIKIGTTKIEQSEDAKFIHLKGCSEKLQIEAYNHLLCILAIVAGIILVEIFALMISLCLCCAVGDREDDYKS